MSPKKAKVKVADEKVVKKTKTKNTDVPVKKTQCDEPPTRKKHKKVRNSSGIAKAENMSMEKKLVKVKGDDDSSKENSSEEAISWPEKDLVELFNRMEAHLPEKDTLAFGTRTDKLSWENIAFKDYSAQDCKKTWLLVQKRLRRFRILSEVLSDAKEWISKPWSDFYKGVKSKRHPDMPRRPLSTYMLFYLKKKDKILADNPGIEMTAISKKIAEMYKSISSEKREKYVKMAAEGRKDYGQKLQEFYQKYPDISRNGDRPSASRIVDVGLKKPSTPFGLFYESQLKKLGNSTDVDKNAFKESCKQKWKHMSDKKKVLWIDWALEEEAKYMEELKNYMSENPEFNPGPLKPVITKEEKLIKERAAGKPVKPPNSAYGLFSRKMLQSEEIKLIDPKNRMNFIANKWKSCTDEEKKQYREHVTHLMEQYKLDFASYLESLTEEKRREELMNTLPKRKLKTPIENSEVIKNKKAKKSSHIENDAAVTKKTDRHKAAKKIISGTSEEEKVDMGAILSREPEKPPVSGFAYFAKLRDDEVIAANEWREMDTDKKKKYDTKVKKLEDQYLKKYEMFLKSLTKKQLKAFSKLRNPENSTKDNDDTESEEISSNDSSSDSDSQSS